VSISQFCKKVVGRANAISGLTTKIPPTLIPRALHSPSAQSSSSTPRRPSALSSHTPLPLAVTPLKFSVSSTLFKLATSTALPHLSTGSLVMMLSSTPASRTRKPRPCSLSSASLSHIFDLPLCQRRRLLRLFRLMF
jgi:hypothetical protein